MVRLVFRPYTQVWRTICTSVSLRASTRVSPGFTLLKHSSPSFGSYQICSYSNLSQKIMVGRCCRKRANPQPWHLILTFIKPMSFCTRKLAYVIDSLVRVSRRVSKSRCGRTYPQAELKLNYQGIHGKPWTFPWLITTNKTWFCPLIMKPP